jgi:hypothetical protein
VRKFGPYRPYSFQNVESSVVIPMALKAAALAIVFTLAQCFAGNVSALETGLACPATVNFHVPATSLFSFVTQAVLKVRPCSIVNRLGESATSHSFDVQRFNGNQIKLSNQPFRQFVNEVFAAVSRPQVQLRNSRLSEFSPLRSLAATGYNTLSAPKFSLHGSIPARVLDLLAGAESSKRFKTNVNANSRRGRLDFGCCRLAIVGQNLREPAVSTLHNAQRLWRPVYRAQVATADQAKFRHSDSTANYKPLFIREIKRSPSTATFEAGIPRRQPGLHSPEECIERFVQSVKCVSLNPRWNGPHTFVVFTPLHEHSGLCHVRSGLAATLVNLDPVFEEVIPNTPSDAHPGIERPLLRFGRIQANGLDGEHRGIIQKISSKFETFRQEMACACDRVERWSETND